jgi:hypothetical protein
VLLEETDRLLTCAHCRVRLFLASGDFFRYHLAPSTSASNEIFYVPYWRFKGMLFSCRAPEVVHKVLDTSFPAVDLRFLPLSLGYRPQTLKLRFVSAQTTGRFARPSAPFPRLAAALEAPANAVNPAANPEASFHQVFLGETLSAIYAPLFVQNGVLHDAVLTRPLLQLPADDWQALQFRAQPPDWQLHLIATLCPHCGWDLEGERDSLVLLCRNCHSAWQTSSKGLERLELGVAPANEKTVLYLPFWRMKTQVNGLQLKSYADMARLANLPKAIPESWETMDFHFWSPAFKIRPGVFLQLAKLLTTSQPLENLEATLPKAPLYPVTFAAGEAVESMHVTLAHVAVPKRHIISMLPTIDIHLRELLLVFLPFEMRGSELIQSSLRLGIHRNVLNLGRKL